MSNPNDRAGLVDRLKNLQYQMNDAERYHVGATIAAAISEIESIGGNWMAIDILRQENHRLEKVHEIAFAQRDRADVEAKRLAKECDGLASSLRAFMENDAKLRAELERRGRMYETAIAERDAARRGADRANAFAQQQRGSYERMRERMNGTRPANRRPIPQGGENRTLIDALEQRVARLERSVL